MPESAKEGDSVLPEGSDIGLGPRGREFEPLHSDQNPSEIVDFRGVFLFFVYCGAGGEYDNKNDFKTNCWYSLYVDLLSEMR